MITAPDVLQTEPLSWRRVARFQTNGRNPTP